MWADDLAGLLRDLDLGPAWLAGASAGARVSYLSALRHPDMARGLLLWSVSGGPYASQVLGYQYHTPFINEALRAGMAAVAATAFFSERIAANPANEEIILSTPTDAFVAALRAWNESFFYRPDTPVIGATDTELRSLRLPALVFEGNDDIHPGDASRAFASLGAWSRASPERVAPRRVDGPLRRTGTRRHSGAVHPPGRPDHRVRRRSRAPLSTGGRHFRTRRRSEEPPHAPCGRRPPRPPRVRWSR